MSNNEVAANSLRTKTKEGNKCQFCLKVFASFDFLHAHYKKRHPKEYVKEGLENQENIQLMANLLSAADQAQGSSD